MILALPLAVHILHIPKKITFLTLEKKFNRLKEKYICLVL